MHYKILDVYALILLSSFTFMIDANKHLIKFPGIVVFEIVTFVALSTIILYLTI